MCRNLFSRARCAESCFAFSKEFFNLQFGSWVGSQRMEEINYTVDNAVMSGVFDFQAKRFFKGRQYREQWDEFFSHSIGPKKWRKETLYSGLTAKIRVEHATKGRRSQCPAASTLTISMDLLVETAREFEFKVSSSHPTASVCTCLCKLLIKIRNIRARKHKDTL